MSCQNGVEIRKEHAMMEEPLLKSRHKTKIKLWIYVVSCHKFGLCWVYPFARNETKCERCVIHLQQFSAYTTSNQGIVPFNRQFSSNRTALFTASIKYFSPNFGRLQITDTLLLRITAISSIPSSISCIVALCP